MRRALITLMMCASSYAAPEEPDLRGAVAAVEIPAPYLTLGKLVVSLEQTTLPALATQIGQGTVRGNELCYAIGNDELVLFSDREFGGSEQSITDFRIQRPPKGSEGCASLPSQYLPIRTGGWLELGALRKDVEGRLGPRGSATGRRVAYLFLGNSPGACAEQGFDLTAWLTITYEASRVVAIAAGQVTTC